MPWDRESILEAIEETKEKSTKRKFLQSIELIINLQGVDLKKPDERIQERVELPNGTGKGNKICVFATGGMALRARKGGADLVIERNQLETMMGDKKKQKELIRNFDLFVAEAPLMPIVGRVLGSTFGPKGKMPSPVRPTGDVAEQIERHRKMTSLRSRGQPVLQCRVGTEALKNEEIAENVQAVIRVIERKLKKGIKNVRSMYLKTSMGPAVQIKK